MCIEEGSIGSPELVGCPVFTGVESILGIDTVISGIVVKDEVEGNDVTVVTVISGICVKDEVEGNDVTVTLAEALFSNCIDDNNGVIVSSSGEKPGSNKEKPIAAQKNYRLHYNVYNHA